MIYRTHPTAPEGYTNLHKGADGKLKNSKAFLFWGYILTMPDDWKFKLEEVKLHPTNRVEKYYRSHLLKLIENYYAIAVYPFNKKTNSYEEKVDYIFFDGPCKRHIRKALKKYEEIYETKAKYIEFQ